MTWVTRWNVELNLQDSPNRKVGRRKIIFLEKLLSSFGLNFLALTPLTLGTIVLVFIAPSLTIRSEMIHERLRLIEKYFSNHNPRCEEEKVVSAETEHLHGHHLFCIAREIGRRDFEQKRWTERETEIRNKLVRAVLYAGFGKSELLQELGSREDSRKVLMKYYPAVMRLIQDDSPIDCETCSFLKKQYG